MDNPKVTVVDRTTGKKREADVGSGLQDEFLQGKVGFTPGTTVPAVMDGDVYDFPVEKIEGALKAGWKLAGKPDVLMQEARDSPLRAATEAGASALTLGFTDLVARQAGADPEKMAARRQTAAAGVGEGAAMALQLAAGGLATGAEGALGAAAKAVSFTDALGAAAASKVESALAQTGLGMVAKKAIGMGAAGLVEGAVVGAGQGISEAALGDPELNAEVLLGAMGRGALTGGLFGGATGALIGGVAGKLGSKSVPHVETPEEFEKVLQTSGVRTDGVDKSFMQRASEWLGGLTTNGEAASLEKINSRDGQRILREGEAATTEAATKMAATLDEVNVVAKELDDFTTASRAKLVRNEIPDAAGDDAVAQLADLHSTIRRELQGIDMDSEMLGLGTKGGAKLGEKLSVALDEAENRVFKAAGVERKYLAQVEEGVDSMGTPKFSTVEKTRTLEDLAGLYDNARPVAVAVHDVTDNLRTLIEQTVKGKSDDIAKRFTGPADAVKAALHDDSVWGDAARIHKLMDDAATKRADMQAYLSKSFRNENGKIIPESVKTHVAGLLNVDADTSVSKLREFAQSNKDLMQTLYAAGADVGGVRATQAKLEKFARQVDGVEKPLRERVAVFNATKQIAAARRSSMAAASNVATYGLGAAIGATTGLSGAPLGLAAAGAYTVLTDPVRFAVNRARIGHAIDTRMRVLNENVQRLVSGNAPLRVTAAASRVTAEITAGKTYAERAEAFRKRIDEVQYDATALGQMDREGSMKDLAEAAPTHADALAAKQDLATRMLLSAIPQPLPAPGGLGLRPPTYTDSAMRRFARLDMAIQDPQTILKDAMDGKVSHEARQVLHTLYPQLATTIQAQLITSMDDPKFKLSPMRARAIKLLLTPVDRNDMQRMTQLQGIITMPAPQAQGGNGTNVAPTTDVMSAADTLLKQ